MTDWLDRNMPELYPDVPEPKTELSAWQYFHGWFPAFMAAPSVLACPTGPPPPHS